jgi:hypothetical protein
MAIVATVTVSRGAFWKRRMITRSSTAPAAMPMATASATTAIQSTAPKMP